MERTRDARADTRSSPEGRRHCSHGARRLRARVRGRPPPGWLDRVLGSGLGPILLYTARRNTRHVHRRDHGIASGYVLAKGRFPGRDVLETIGSLPIILPPTVIGFYLLEVLSPGTRVGGFLTRVVGHVLVYNVYGCIIAATMAAFPFCMRAARTAIEGVDPSLEQAARTMGLPNWRVALPVTLPLARRGHRRRADDRMRPGPR